MANALLTPSIIAKESLFQLENNCVMGGLVHRKYKKEFVKVGNTITIRKPVKFTVTDGATRSNQDVTEPSTTIVIDKRKHVSWSFSTQDLTLTVEDYSERYIKPAMIKLANQIDQDLCQEGAENFYNRVGTPGTTPANFQALSDVSLRLDDESVPDDGMRNLVVNPAARWGLANGLGGTGSGGVFNADMVGDFVRKGRLGNIAQLEIYGDQNVFQHLTGTHSGTPAVNDAGFVNNTNAVSFDGMVGAVANAMRKGDVFTIAGVFAVNDVSKQSTGVLRQFVVTTDVTTGGGGGVATVFPVLNDGSVAANAAYQTVDSLPADNAAITIVGDSAVAYTQNLAFHENAIALVTVPLELPDSATFKARADWRGYSIRVIKDYDIDSDDEIIRLDILYGTKTIYPELGVRLDG